MDGIQRVSCIIGTAGHVDHGKTSLVRALTGIDTDRLAEEKRRGVSIELGYAYLELGADNGNIRAAVVDVPGHERFIKNMLAGATGMDLVLFAVASDDGVMPQTREHLNILRLLGIKNAIFALTKCDAALPERTDEVERDLRRLLSATVFKDAPFARVSALTGHGIAGLKKLIGERIVQRSPATGAFFRLPVDRVFSIAGFGTVVAGSIASGSVGTGDELLSFPSGHKCRVKGIQSLFLNVNEAGAGQRAALNIPNIGTEAIKRGDMLVSPALKEFIDDSVKAKTYSADCSFEFVHDPAGDAGRKRPQDRLRHCTLYHFTGSSPARVRLLNGRDGLDEDTAHGRLFFRRPLLMLRQDRFILRDNSTNTTVGGGTVLRPYLPDMRAPKLDDTAFAGESDEGMALLSILSNCGGFLEESRLCLMLNISEEALKAHMRGSARIKAIHGLIALSETVDRLRQKLTDALESCHRTHPSDEGVTEDGLLKGLIPSKGGRKGAERNLLFAKKVLRAMLDEGLVKKSGALLSLPSHKAALPLVDEAMEIEILGSFSSPGGEFKAMDAEELYSLRPGNIEIKKAVAALLKAEKLVRIKGDVLAPKTAVDAAREKLVSHIRKNGSIKAAEFRDLLGCGRKLAIELLEYFDGVKITLRSGDVRTLR